MNTKRQTIWLVSMLSLMVVLSAYYLFTEDTTSKQTATGTQAEQVIKGDATEVGQLPNVQITEVSAGDSNTAGKEQANAGEKKGTENIANGNAGHDTQDPTGAPSPAPADTSKSVAGKEDTKTNEDVLNEAVAGGVTKRSMIEEKQMERNEQYQQNIERLLGIINDTTNITGDKLTKAYDEMHQLDEREQKITNLETELQKEYDNAVITQDNDRYKVVVQSAKLEVKQAVDIMDKLIKELNVTQDKISVQYVSE
ncbi:SpoIIIAH-like family protein [Paenibacillus sp. UMB4589-SE434]|uniref:SpoIIIAH-like family protein n=1 Tax=Paenibacillus sp. UMB4589-SE434 TaxID=3046314 RepID=UPI00254DA81E|nr:SpoIIIAH-like family protein [Paenibacillus sp. UMB4589-SE434]MDK8179338.1 SpoIIIAH-like family protein [Paenibacillus sp. UMB4589-SE434]